MQVLQEGVHPNRRSCPTCGTVFIYDKRDFNFERGEPGRVVDKFRYEIVYYPDAYRYVCCPLCKQRIVIERVPDHSEESLDFW